MLDTTLTEDEVYSWYATGDTSQQDTARASNAGASINWLHLLQPHMKSLPEYGEECPTLTQSDENRMSIM